MSLRILTISAAYTPSPGGVATHVANLTHELLRLKKDIFISVVASGEKKDTEPSGISGRLQVWKIKKKDVPNYFGRRAPLSDIISFAMGNWHKIKADIIHAHDFDSTYIGWMLKVAFDIPLIMTLHRAPSRWKNLKYRESPKDCFLEVVKRYGLVDFVVVPSDESKNILIDQGFNDKVEVIPHGINYKFLSSVTKKPLILEELNIDDDTIFILCPIRADEHKNPETFLRAAAFLKKDNPLLKFVFLLTDEPSGLYRELPSSASSYGLKVNQEIFFKSFKYTEMPTIYRRANICVFPSFRDSFGQSVLEAFVFNAPVVKADVSSISEIIKHNHNGLLYDNGSHEDLAKQMQRIIVDPIITKHICENGFKDVKANYNMKLMIESYLELYTRTRRNWLRKK